VASARSQVEAQHSQLVAARAERQGTLNALLAREKELVGEITPSADPPGAGATLVNGRAIAPPDAPLVVKAVIDAANRIATRPYIWGGGHGSFESAGYDCSGAVSYALHGGGLLSSPLDSTGLMSWGAPGGGSWITVYAHSGHTFAVIAGLRWDTSGDASGSGPRWHADIASPAGFVARHAPGL
jgi:cell wall-associated NlpC family hydrolase